MRNFTMQYYLAYSYTRRSVAMARAAQWQAGRPGYSYVVLPIAWQGGVHWGVYYGPLPKAN